MHLAAIVFFNTVAVETKIILTTILFFFFLLFIDLNYLNQ